MFCHYFANKVSFIRDYYSSSPDVSCSSEDTPTFFELKKQFKTSIITSLERKKEKLNRVKSDTNVLEKLGQKLKMKEHKDKVQRVNFQFVYFIPYNDKFMLFFVVERKSINLG